MPQLPKYKYTGPLDCTVQIDTSNLKGKSIIVTGGANGIGEAYVRAFAKADAFITIGDVDESSGQKLVAEFPINTQFVKCDVTNWDDQLAMFKKAIASSPSKSCDIVIANAGVVGKDEVFLPEDTEHPSKPNLRMIDVDMIGVLYTTKLALHYFRQQEDSDDRDRCLILQGSVAGYVDHPETLQYNTTKFGLRGLMRGLRRTAPREGIRVNMVAPWYILTEILRGAAEQALVSNGIEFAEVDDAARAALRIAADRTVAGVALGVLPRADTPTGFRDMDHDDYDEGDWLDVLQNRCIASGQGVERNDF